MWLNLLIGWIPLVLIVESSGHSAPHLESRANESSDNICLNARKNVGPRHCPINDDNLLWFILSLFVIIAWGAFVRTFLRINKVNIPYTVILMLTGLILGSGTRISDDVCNFWSQFTKIARLPPKIILYTFLPVLIFESAYSVDVHVFMRSLSQILVIAFPGMFLSVFLTGFICIGFMTTYHWTYPTAFMFGSIISTTDPVAVVAILKELGTSKKLCMLIEGESVINDAVSVVLYEIFRKIVEGQGPGRKDTENHNVLTQIVLTLIKNVFGGPAFGLVTGKICAICLGMIFNDAATEITITLFSTYLVYWFAEQMGISGVISVAVMALKLREHSTSISPEVQKEVHHFWEMVGYLASTVLFVLVGIILSELAIGQIVSIDWFNLFFLYANLSILRLAVLMILMPWLTRTGYGYSWQEMVMCTWSGLRGTMGICLALQVYYSTAFCQIGDDGIAPKFLFLMGGMVFLTLSLNGTTTKAMLEILHLTDVSSGRLQDMSNAIKQILATKERAILQYRHNRSFTDANWKYVKKYTRMHDPYREQREKDRMLKMKRVSTKSTKSNPLESDDGSLTTVESDPPQSSIALPVEVEPAGRKSKIEEVEPVRESVRDSIIEIDYEELSGSKNRSVVQVQHKSVVEAEESRQRVMKALKVSFWRQYEKGVLSDVAVQILIGVADKVGDMQLRVIHAKDFEKYYELHGFFHWFQANIVERVRLDAPSKFPRKPKAKWRRRLWWLSTRDWFNGILTLIVILSLIPAVYEFVLVVKAIHETDEQRIGFLVSNLVFNTIYLSEFLIKICGLGVAGYFKDKWNWVDAFVLVFGIVNVAVILAPANIIGSASAAFSLLRGFRVVKIIRTLRLLKCCVTWTREFMDNRINYSIFIGYDIGTGFVKAVEDVVKFLPQMVENERVLRQLEVALQTERLDTIRLLGLLQQKHPSIAIAVKTRHASRAVLNEMRETVEELRDDGLLDQTESDVLMTLIESKMKGLWSTPVNVTPNTPEAMLQNILWLHVDDLELRQAIQESAKLKFFTEGDIISSVGDKSDGLYLIVNGMVEVHFIPTLEIMLAQRSTGQLPNVEVLGNMTFSFEDTDYLQVGYLLGEIGLLTGLPSSTTITCATFVTLYHIPLETMMTAMEMHNTMEDNLEARIWRAVGMRIAVTLLPAEPEYQSWTVDRIHAHVEHSAVPIGYEFENMTIPDYITDIVLLQGEIQDANSKELFIAPRLLPGSCKKLSKVSESTVPTRFLVIAEDELLELDSDDGLDTGSSEADAWTLKSVHQLVKRASRVSGIESVHDVDAKPSVRQRNLLKKIQYEWH